LKYGYKQTLGYVKNRLTLTKTIFNESEALALHDPDKAKASLSKDKLWFAYSYLIPISLSHINTPNPRHTSRDCWYPVYRDVRPE